MTTAAFIITAITLGIVFIVAIGVVPSKGETSSTTPVTTPRPPLTTTTESEDIGSGLVLVSRNDWFAEKPEGTPVKLKLPTHKVVIAHTVTPPCSSKKSCSQSVKSMQEFHKGALGYGDIGYNFLVGGDGRVYEGRGWENLGAHTKLHNSDTIGIGFIGNFMHELPPEKQINAAKLIIEEGVKLNKLAKDYKLYGAKQIIATESPGAALFANIRNWPNWSNDV